MRQARHEAISSIVCSRLPLLEAHGEQMALSRSCWSPRRQLPRVLEVDRGAAGAGLKSGTRVAWRELLRSS